MSDEERDLTEEDFEYWESLPDDDPAGRFTDTDGFHILSEEESEAFLKRHEQRLKEMSRARIDTLAREMHDTDEDAEKILKSLYGEDAQKAEEPIEEWADEYLCKDVIKADLSIFVRALMSIKHWIFSSLSVEESENIYTALVTRMVSGKWSLKDLRETIQEAEPELTDYEAERIARSESTLIVNKSREMTFEADPQGRKGYYWSGPSDHRTTEICANIKARTPKQGFDSVEELKAVVKEEAEKYYKAHNIDMQVREWLPHPGCRCTIVSKER